MASPERSANTETKQSFVENPRRWIGKRWLPISLVVLGTALIF